MRAHRPEGFLEKLVVPLKPSGRFPSFLRRYKNASKNGFYQRFQRSSASHFKTVRWLDMKQKGVNHGMGTKDHAQRARA
jgi:hypothetical protein